MQTYLKKFPLLILLFCILFGVASCKRAIRNDSDFTSNSIDEHYFSFEPATILSDIVNGNESYTRLESFTTDYDQDVDTVFWSQADYYAIMNSIFEHAWQESPHDFRLRGIELRTGCEDIEEKEGFGWASFEFYRLLSSTKRETKHVTIDTPYNEIYLGTVYDFPLIKYGYFVEEDYLETGLDTLTAEEVLEIAEIAAGIDYRKLFQNRCNIYVSYNSDGKYDGWTVYYQSRGVSLTVVVDEHSGEYEIIQNESVQEPNDSEYYAFEPTAILNDIANDTEMFELIDDAMQYTNPGEYYYWSQAEYVEIAKSLSEHAWQNPLQDFRFMYILFETECEAINEGFHFAHFGLNRLLPTGHKEWVKNEDTLLMIEPYYGQIHVWTDAYDFPIDDVAYFEDNYLEIGPDILTADDALAIAENAFGADYRQQAGNECDIKMYTEAKGRYDGWEIRYWNPELDLLHLVVNAETGEYEIIEE